MPNVTEAKRISGALVLLDADVLYPIRVCDFILTAASLRMIARPVVSDMILEEAARNVKADRPDTDFAVRIDRRFVAVRSAVDGHDVPIPQRYVDSSIINPKDQHVLAAALHHGAQFVVSNDTRLRREINKWLSLNGRHRRLTAAISADELASRLIEEAPNDVEAVVRSMASRFRNPPRSYAEVLASLVKSMPTFVTLQENASPR